MTTRLFYQFLILCLLHQSVTSLYRFIASHAQTHILSFLYQFMSVALLQLFGGFILPKRKTTIIIESTFRTYTPIKTCYMLLLCSSLYARMVKLGILGFSIVLCTNQHSDQWIPCTKMAKGEILWPIIDFYQTFNFLTSTCNFFQETMQNKTIGNQILTNYGLDYSRDFYWISVGVLLGYTIFFYIAFGLALAYRKRKFTNKNA